MGRLAVDIQAARALLCACNRIEQDGVERARPASCVGDHLLGGRPLHFRRSRVLLDQCRAPSRRRVRGTRTSIGSVTSADLRVDSVVPDLASLSGLEASASRTGLIYRNASDYNETIMISWHRRLDQPAHPQAHPRLGSNRQLCLRSLEDACIFALADMA